MKRKIERFLLERKNKSNYLPLVIKDADEYEYIKTGIKFANKNIGFNGEFYTFPYFTMFLLKDFLKNLK